MRYVILELGQIHRTLRIFPGYDDELPRSCSALFGDISIRNGSNTIGYFTWSFLDVLELLDGYESSFGHYYVDLDDPDLKRYPKLSADWYAQFLKGKSVGPEPGTLIGIGNNPSAADSK